MDNKFIPENDFSLQLLKSVPKKIVSWLDNLQVDITHDGEFGNLSWSFAQEAGFVKFEDSNSAQNPIYIQWVGNALDPSEIFASDSRFKTLDINLDFFAWFEKNIYGELEKLQEKLDDEYNSANGNI